MRRYAQGFTLIELLVVLIIAGILVGLAIPNYTKTREKAMDKEARAILSLIRSAEKMYNMKQAKYYPNSSSTPAYPASANLTQLNPALQLDLSSGSWDYTIDGNAAGDDFTARATRSGGARQWQITKDSAEAYCVAACL